VTSHKKKISTNITRSSAAAPAPLLKPSLKRIIKGGTCITVGITKESIKCNGCLNVAQKGLGARVRSASIDLREYKCRQPWVINGKTDHLIQIYENTWKELVDQLGYVKSKLYDQSKPTGRCLQAQTSPNARSGRNQGCFHQTRMWKDAS
jgi:hypothetical protein